jgi:16S rRNA (guanine966-N2)-methyltransferase
MRIITGKFRGRRLRGPCGTDLRPTSDRLKESLFNILGPVISGSIVLDVFAGSGAIGLEAISRGAREVVFLEASRKAVQLIRQNIELCGVASGYRILSGDVFASLRTLAREGFKADIAFLDPPYHWGPYRDLLEILFHSGIAGSASRVVVEHHRKAALPETGGGFRCARIVRQSDKCLSFYQMTI